MPCPAFASRRRSRTHGATGVEMEALTAVSVACLTLFDMLKAIDRTMAIGGIAVTSKSGGRSGAGAGRMISFDEAVALVAEVARPLGRETFADRRGSRAQCLAAPVVAAARLAAARRLGDGRLRGPRRRPCRPPRASGRGEVLRRRGFEGTVEAGTCVRIFTGAPVPAGADRVVIQEEVRREGDVAIFEMAPGDGSQHSGGAARISQAGEVLLVRPGGRLDPARDGRGGRRLTLAASKSGDGRGIAMLAHRRRAGRAGPGRDRTGCDPRQHFARRRRRWPSNGARIVVDRVGMRRRPVVDGGGGWPVALAGADLVVVTGGASVGEKDYAKAMFAPAWPRARSSRRSRSSRASRSGSAAPAGGWCLGCPAIRPRRWSRRGCLLAPLVAGLGGAIRLPSFAGGKLAARHGA